MWTVVRHDARHRASHPTTALGEKEEGGVRAAPALSGKRSGVWRHSRGCHSKVDLGKARRVVTRLATNRIIAGEEGEDVGMGGGGRWGYEWHHHWHERVATQHGAAHGVEAAAGRRPGVGCGRAAFMASAMRLFGHSPGCCWCGAGAAAPAVATGGMSSCQAWRVYLDRSLLARNDGNEGSDRSNEKEQRSVNKNNIRDTLCIPLYFICIGAALSIITAQPKETSRGIHSY